MTSIKYIKQLAGQRSIRRASSTAKVGVGVDATKPNKDDNAAAVAVSNIVHTVSLGSKLRKDVSAQGVARVRHCESLLPPEQRLYCDPYAYAMHSNGTITQWLGPKMMERIDGWMGLVGFREMISVRTRWLDDQVDATIHKKVEQERAKQLVILGAGYDTRGFRLDLWKDSNNEDFRVVEVDQPEVQENKIKKMQWLVQNDDNGKDIADRMDSKKVQFLPVDFNSDDLQQQVQLMEGFNANVPSVVILEGVTQYIPKESTADTLKKIKDIVPPGSTLLITHVPEKFFAPRDTLTKAQGMILWWAEKVGEPWISGWSTEEFEDFLNDCGYQVISSTTQTDYNHTYLKSVGRKMDEKNL
eukprot:CAMPEP_0183730376 /NCGR_PEP_ID=MMETSP0737-20130205/32688_1 /TAXON_ID=385413 /ORGANISM="Thalassiosira miniscula, Strain CCMP1093" /LENGTH=356 /DNA_ID=CAMNT_0025962853 /DNA_START=18 /DNA_END=1084 /DNA_ORIENTATION=+